MKVLTMLVNLIAREHSSLYFKLNFAVNTYFKINIVEHFHPINNIIELHKNIYAKF